MLRLFFLLQIVLFGNFIFCSAASENPTPTLAQLSITEINKRFHEANEKFKTDALTAELELLCENLNGSVLLAFNDQVVFKREVGFKLLKKQTPINSIDSATLFDLASISKQFTAAAILKLREAKKLSLNDDVKKYLPNFPYEKITLHHLLTHTSGLPEYMDFPEKDFNQEDTLTNSQLEEYIELRKPKKLFEPGAKYKYINTNYALLALIVEKITDTSFEQYVRKEIFTPAGLVATCFATELKDKKNYAKGHLANETERPFHFQNGVIGDKGVYTNVDELYRWMKAYLIDYKILPKEVVEEAAQPQNKLLKGKPEEKYGYGLRIEEGSHGYLIYHGGLWRGFQSNMVYRPEDGYIFIVLSNFRNRAMVGVNGKLLGTINGV
jgi:CubicO group peptidase (beta-lactamase class C family)